MQMTQNWSQWVSLMSAAEQTRPHHPTLALHLLQSTPISGLTEPRTWRAGASASSLQTRNQLSKVLEICLLRSVSSRWEAQRIRARHWTSSHKPLNKLAIVSPSRAGYRTQNLYHYATGQPRKSSVNRPRRSRGFKRWRRRWSKCKRISWRNSTRPA